MKDFFFKNDKLLDELENKFNSSENDIDDLSDDPFNIEIDFEDNSLYKNLTNDEDELSIKIDTKREERKEQNLNYSLNDIDDSNLTKSRRGRPKGSLKKVSREKIVDQKLTISLTLEEKELLEKKAADDDRSVSSFIRIKLKEAGIFK